MSKCEWPTCKEEAVKGVYCFMHYRVYGTKEIKQSPKPIAKKSAKMVLNDRELTKIKKQVIKPGVKCAIKSPVCTGFAETLDHVQKRSPNNRVDKKNLIPCCRKCNLYKEEHPKSKSALKNSKSRFVK